MYVCMYIYTYIQIFIHMYVCMYDMGPHHRRVRRMRKVERSPLLGTNNGYMCMYVCMDVCIYIKRDK